MNSKSQMRKEEKYGKKARKALNEAIENEDPQLNDLAILEDSLDYVLPAGFIYIIIKTEFSNQIYTADLENEDAIVKVAKLASELGTVTKPMDTNLPGATENSVTVGSKESET